MKMTFVGGSKELREFLCRVICKQQPRARLWVFHEGADKPITERPTVMLVKLSKPIAPGFYRECSIATDEAVDVDAAGVVARSETIVGDSSPARVRTTSDPERPSTSKLINFDVMGDGAIGAKQTNITVDGHVGDGEVAITLEVEYEVANKDATEFVSGSLIEGADKAIA